MQGRQRLIIGSGGRRRPRRGCNVEASAAQPIIGRSSKKAHATGQSWCWEYSPLVRAPGCANSVPLVAVGGARDDRSIQPHRAALPRPRQLRLHVCCGVPRPLSLLVDRPPRLILLMQLRLLLAARCCLPPAAALLLHPLRAQKHPARMKANTFSRRGRFCQAVRTDC